MAREEFYQSQAWKSVRKIVWIKQSCLCIRCHRAVYVHGLSDPLIPKDKRIKGIVHHKEYLNDSNVYDNNVSLNEDMLEGLCIDCHNTEHFKKDILRSDVMFDETGNLIARK